MEGQLDRQRNGHNVHSYNRLSTSRPGINYLKSDFRSYCKFGNFRKGFIFTNFAYAKFVKIKSLRNGEITLSTIEIIP